MKIIRLDLRHERWARILVATIATLDGQIFEREIEDHGDAAAVLPYDPQLRVALLIRQMRAPCLHAAGMADLLEVPAGRLEDITPADCARREALEESGVQLQHLEPVATVWSMPGLSTERAHLFLAPYQASDRIGKGGGLAEEQENIVVAEYKLAALAAMADLGELTDLKALLLVQTLRLRRPELFQ